MQEKDVYLTMVFIVSRKSISFLRSTMKVSTPASQENENYGHMRAESKVDGRGGYCMKVGASFGSRWTIKWLEVVGNPKPKAGGPPWTASTPCTPGPHSPETLN